MPSGRGLFSPVGTTSVSRVTPTPQDYISPSTRRRVNVTGTPATTALSTLLVTPSINDDEAERKERRKSKVLELQRRNLNSPATPSAERRQSLPLGGLSNVQVTEHYSNCIKLSTENKINAKNAFGLHLIDYMSELLKKKEMNNFQVASSTLDASAKIYAGRVDAIHSETYKVLSGLGRGADKGDNKAEDGNKEGDVENGSGDGKENKRKRARKSNTIETNLKSLNVNKLDLEFEVDPLFSKTSAAFDEGGTGGLLLNHLRCLDDTSELLLDSNTIVCNMDELPPTDSQSERGRKMVDLSEMRAAYTGMNLEQQQICPAFMDFEFTNWNREGDSQVTFLDKLSGANSSPSKEHAFDLNAEVEPIPDTQSTDTQSDLGEGRGYMDDFDHMDDDYDAAGDADHTSRDYCLGDGKEAQMVTNAIDNIKHGTIGNLMQILAAEPSDYSYFNSNLLRTWAGPDHWKLRPKSKDPKSHTENTDKSKKTKEKKEAYVLNYKEEIDFDAHFKESRASTTLTKATLDKYSNSQTTLPEDLHYDADKLFRLFAKPKLMIKRHAKSKNVDDGVENYDYNNENDRENFCPDVDDGGDDDDDNTGDFNFTAGSNDVFGQGSFIGNDTALNGTMLTGDKLVDQPRKVAKIDIDYAKAAKRMDVKKLKTSMWNILVKPEENVMQEEKAEEDKKEVSPEKVDDPDNVVAGLHSFQTLINELPGSISKNMSKNLSVPIAFVCLLHLANERMLKITSDESMADLKILQG